MDPIPVEGGVVVPAAALSFSAVRASGPGGQNVNKVASKVELRLDLARVTGMPAAARARLARLAAGRFDAAGRLVVRSQRTRDQGRNLEDARAKLRALLTRALEEPRPRRATKPSRAARERRLAEKRRGRERKSLRGRVRPEEG